MTTPLGAGLIGAGWIGAFHGESLARRVPGARLAMVADPAPGAAARLADALGARSTTDPGELIADPEVEAVVIAAPARFHADLVVAAADALARPDWRDRGLLDTSVVTIRFDNGAMATAEASFHAVYGYDIRGEVFGSAGLITAGDVRRDTMTFYGQAGAASGTWRRNVDLFRDAYVAELAEFTACVREKTAPPVTGRDARAALAIALAAIRSVQTGAPVRLADVEPAPAAT